MNEADKAELIGAIWITLFLYVVFFGTYYYEKYKARKKKKS